MANRTFYVGVVGYGMSAKVFHIPLLAEIPELKFYAVVQRNPTGENDAKQDHPGIKSYRSGEEMIQDKTVDVVVITTTPESHFGLAKLALENKKHVIVEKPFTPTFAEAEELVAIAKKHQRLLTVYQNRRWDSDFLTLSALLKTNTLGRVVEFETHFDRHRPDIPTTSTWKTVPSPGGGAIYDLGAHLIDQVVTTFGLPRSVTGFVGTQRDSNPTGYEDSCTVLLHYPGMLATIKTGVVSPEVNQLRFWVRGVKGSYKKHHLDCQESQLKQGHKPSDAGFGVEPVAHHGVLTSITDEGIPTSRVWPTVEPLTYTTFYRQFAAALQSSASPAPVPVPVDPQEAANVIRLIELARESSRNGRTVAV